MTIQSYHRPETIAEALKLLHSSADIEILAGGTNIVTSSKPGGVVDLQRLPLNEIVVDATTATIGSMVRLQSIVDSADLPPFIRQLAQNEAINTFRNAGTLGGLVARAENDSELFAGLLVFEATIQFEDRAGSHTIPLSEYQPATIGRGIITDVTLHTDGTAVYERVARTPGDKPIVAVVGRKKGDTITLAACGAAATPILILPDQIDALTPPADFRGSEAYRRQMVSVLSERVINELGGE
ncbi:MAG: FAD binding domain-containing protein [Chloroflexota bacterium]